MGAEEVNLQPEKENGEFEDFDDAEEILSLCDLPLNSSSCDWEDYSREKKSSTFDEDFFEFVSEDFTASACTKSADDIIFCGRVISYKGAAELEKPESLKNTTTKSFKKNCTFLSKSFSFSKYAAPFRKQQRETISKPEKCAADHYDFSVKKKAPPRGSIKSRSWPSLMLGTRRFPAVMELSDIKMRQSKLSQRRMFEAENGMDKMQRSGKLEKGLWGLLRLLGRKSCQRTAVVKSSFF